MTPRDTPCGPNEHRNRALPPILFLLGGQDLEMVAIRDLLTQQGALFHDRGLAWGAQASAYRAEIEEALRARRVPVLVEIDNDLPELVRSCAFLEDPELDSLRGDPPPANAILVNHHGALAGAERPTALHQVFRLLRLPPERWTRHFDLVAANDRGHIRAMLKLEPPASLAEMTAIRAADRAAQGVTEADEAAARAAVAASELRAGERLTILRLAGAKTSPAADFMERALGGPGFENLLILGAGEINFFGGGGAVVALDKAFPGGWFGGDLPDRGFWGSTRADAERVRDWLEEWLKARDEPRRDTKGHEFTARGL